MENPVVYLLMRTDLPISLNPGKAMAQAHHAGVQMMALFGTHYQVKEYTATTPHKTILHLYTGVGFNTTICLGATEAQINNIVQIAQKLNYVADKVIDPSYPSVDGFIVPDVLTCGWLLGDFEDEIFKGLVANLELHP